MDLQMKVTRPVAPGSIDGDVVSYMNSRQHLSKLEASRLEIHWKKICDREKKSKERNQKLLEDFERVEQHANALAARSDRLMAYKQQYENYINKMYPRWRDELESSRFKNHEGRSIASADQDVLSRHLEVPSRGGQFDSLPIIDPLLSSTLAHPSHQNAPMRSRFHPEDGYSDDLLRNDVFRDPYARHSARLRDSFQPTGDRLPVTQRNLGDAERQTLSGRSRPMLGNEYQRHSDVYGIEHATTRPRSADHHARQRNYARPSDPHQDRRALAEERLPPDSRLSPSVLYPVQVQGRRTAAPYEPRTEFKRSLVGRDHADGVSYPSEQVPAYFDAERRDPYDVDSGPWWSESPEKRYSVQKEVRRNSDPVGVKTSEGNVSRQALLSGQDFSRASRIPPQGTFQSNEPEKASPQRKDRLSSFSNLLESPPWIKTSHKSENVYPDVNDVEESITSPVTSPAEAQKGVSEIREVRTERNNVLSRSVASVNVSPGGQSVEQSLTLSGTSPTVRDEGVSTMLEGKAEDEQPMAARQLPGSSVELSRPMLGLDFETNEGGKAESKGYYTRELSNEDQDVGTGDGEETSNLSHVTLPDGGGSRDQPALQKEESFAINFKEEAEACEEQRNVGDRQEKPEADPAAVKSFTEEQSHELEETGSDLALRIKDQSVSSDGRASLKAAGKDGARDDSKLHANTDEIDRRTPEENIGERKNQPVSVDGFLSLLYAVDADVEVTFSPETLYRSPECSVDMKEEIIKTAETGASLQSFDPNTISMIVLEQLPFLVTSSLSGCLIPDRVFAKGILCRSEKELRPYVEPSLLKVWKALFSHLVNVVANNVMNAKETGDVFGSLLLRQESTWSNQSQILLRRILEHEVSDGSVRSASPPTSPGAEEFYSEPQLETEAPTKNDDKLSIASESSNSTLGSTPPRNNGIKPNLEESRKQTPDPTVSYEDDFDDEEVPLTETAAYRKMMSSAHSEPDDDISDLLGESGPTKSQTDANEDVERELARAISPPASSPRQKSPSQSKGGEKQRPKLSLFESGGETVADILGDSWGGSSLQSGRSEMSESTSPPLSAGTAGGYVPSALETKEQDTAAENVERTERENNDNSEAKSYIESKAKRKTDFWNNSDTESEVDLQLSTGGLDEDDDDFDFYG